MTETETKPAPVEEVFLDAEEFNRDVQISTVDLDESFRNQASLYAYYSFRHYKATIDLERKKIRAEVKEARVAKELRDEAAETGAKITEKAISEQVAIDSGYIRTRLEYNEAKATVELLKSCLEALKQRRDMLVQLGANEREDRKGELRASAPSISINPELLKAKSE